MKLAELIIQMSADTASLKRDFDKASDLASGFAKQVSSVLSGFGIGAGFAGFAETLKSTVEHAAEAGHQLQRTSELTGVTVGHLSGLAVVARENKEDFEALGTVLGRAGKTLESAIIHPGAKSSEVLSAVMGGAKNLASLGLVPMDQALQTVLSKIFAFNNVGERNLALNALVGRGWQSNIKTLKALATEGYDPLVQKAKDLHQYYDENRAAEAARFNKSWQDLKQTFSGISDELGSGLIPLLNQLVHGSAAGTDLSAQWNRMNEDLDKFGAAVYSRGRIITKADIDAHRAPGAESEWQPQLKTSVEALKQQITAINSYDVGLRRLIVKLPQASAGVSSLLRRCIR